MVTATRKDFWQLARFGANGILATAVHFSVLWTNLNILKIPSAGIANFVAALFGITVSFLGNRYFVFQRPDQSLLKQLSKFVVLYGVLALLHGGLLFLWTDLLHGDYKIGFVVATALQMILSFFGSKRLVFKS
jgi:putative flippase GtrA